MRVIHLFFPSMFIPQVVTIPPKQIEEAGWEEGTELEATVEDSKIVLKPKTRA
jgi:antitoxin component of MazEF toxin-antitoxin module